MDRPGRPWSDLDRVSYRSAITLLERDNRLKEDQINQLRWQVEDLQESLQNAQSATSPLTGPPARTPISRQPSVIDSEPASSEPTTTNETTKPAPRAPAAPSRVDEGPAMSAPSELPTNVRPPAVHLPDTPLPAGELPENFRRKDRPAPSNRSGSVTPAADNSLVAQITLNSSLTGGYGRGGRPGGEGLFTVVEPRDLRGQILDAPGDLSIVVLDPAASGDAARVARWDFSAAETTDLLTGDPDRGIYLTLPWPSGPPAHKDLKMYVRYATRDGRKLQIERPFRLPCPAASRSIGRRVRQARLFRPLLEGPVARYGSTS